MAQAYVTTWDDANETAPDQPICNVRNRRVTFFESERHGAAPGSRTGTKVQVRSPQGRRNEFATTTLDVFRGVQ